MGHEFSVEMRSKAHVRSISISNETPERVLFEGDLGELDGVVLIGGSMLEVKGSNGILRVELGQEETKKMISQMSEVRA